MTIRLELLRLRRSRRPWLALGAVIFFLGLMLLGFYTYAQNETGGQVDFRYTFENRSYFNGLTFALYAFYFGFLLVLPIFVATEGAAQLAGDTSAGTMRLLLCRPLARARIFFTKLMLATGFAFALTGALLGSALLLGLLAVGWGDLNLYPGVLQMTARHQHLDQSDALLCFVQAWPAATVALFCPLALSFWISAWVRSPLNALGASVSLYLVLYVVAEIHFFEALRPFLFTSYMSYWRELFREEVQVAKLGQDALKLMGFTALFLALAFRRFRRREEH